MAAKKQVQFHNRIKQVRFFITSEVKNMSDGRIYGYARVSTPRQDPNRQAENIRSQYPSAVILQETYTGTTAERPVFARLLKILKPGDVLVCDEVSRFSRNAEEGFSLYMSLYEKGVSLVFLKEPMLNSDVYRSAAKRQTVKFSTGSGSADKLLAAVTAALDEFTKDMIAEGIRQGFTRAQSEIELLHIRTSEGVRRAQIAGKRIGRLPGTTAGNGFRESRKSATCKKIIKKHAKEFGGVLTDAEIISLCRAQTGKLGRNTYYKYKKELRLSG